MSKICKLTKDDFKKWSALVFGLWSLALILNLLTFAMADTGVRFWDITPWYVVLFWVLTGTEFAWRTWFKR